MRLPQRIQPCATCIADAVRDRLPGGRLRRLLGSAAIALALGGVAAVPIAELRDIGPADARDRAPVARGSQGLFHLPSVKVPTRTPGYQLATTTGDVLPFGAAAAGAAPTEGLANPVVAVARTPSGAGAWTATADGGVLTAGDALFYGSLGGRVLNAPVVALAATPDGGGYWLVAADGGVFAFGNAAGFGSLVGTPHRSVVRAFVPTPGGNGYWIITADGEVFTFGDAKYYGAVGERLQWGITGAAATPTGKGYWMVAGDGGVFTFGDALFYGRPDPAALHAPVIGIASSRSGNGYWVAAADGGVFTFGDAPFLGSSGGGGWGRVVGIAAGAGKQLSPLQQLLPIRLKNRYGHDVSWPQCDGPLPDPGYGFAVVGVTGGRPFTRNRCLADQWRWATSGAAAGAVYVNLASSVTGDGAGMRGPAGDCGPADLPCQTYNYAANAIVDAVDYARSAGVDSPMWWLDVEILNRWTPRPDLNRLTVKASVETLQKLGIRAGVYSTPLMWQTITGGARLGLPAWVAGAPSDAASPGWCNDPSKDFTGGGVWMVQSVPVAYDVNYACSPMLADVASALRVG